VPRVPVKVFGLKVPFLAYDISISDPAFAAMLQMGNFGLGPYGIYQAMQFPAFYRGVALICGEIASLPLKTWKDLGEGEREPAESFLDKTPSGPYGLTPFQWKQQVLFNMVTEQECGLLHVETEGGALIGLMPHHPSTYTPRWVVRNGIVEKDFELLNQTERDPLGQSWHRTQDQFTQIVGLSMDGLRGLSPRVLFQGGIQLALAQEIASMRMMTSGNHISGLVSAKDEDIPKEVAAQIKADVDNQINTPTSAGKMVFVNRRLVFTPWQANNEQAQFMEGRRYAREEAALMLGIPMFKLEPSKQTSWGTGVAEQNLGFARETLMPLTSCVEEAVSAVLKPSAKYVEWDYKGLLQGTPEIEVKLILEQLTAGIMSEEQALELLGNRKQGTFRTPVPVSSAGRVPLEPAEAKPPSQPENEPAPTGASNGTMR
jgi:HK97 family phage portal protein